MKRALIIIDIQNDYFEGGALPLAHAEHAARNAAQLRDSFRSRDWPIIHVQHEMLTPDVPILRPGTHGQRICPELAPKEGEHLIVKHYPNAFWNTRLHEQLMSLDVDSWVLCGMMTHMCVQATAMGGFQHGYRVTLVSDATASCDLQYQGKTLSAGEVKRVVCASLEGTIAGVIGCEDLLTSLLRHPR